MEKPYRVFCCSAREDDEFLQKLKKHLIPLQHEGWITIDADRDIPPGKDWKLEVDRHLETADIILLLVSPDFIASDYCLNEEVPKAIARHEQGTVYTIPIIIRPTDWQGTGLGKLQVLPKDGIPISMCPDRDDAFLSVIDGIRTTIPDFPKHSKPVSLYLEKGSKALWNEDYNSAKKELRKAIEEINEENRPEEAAKARYFFALALLGGKLPRVQGRALMQSVEELMNNAISLYPCASYYRIFAHIKIDFLKYNGFDHRLNEVDLLERRGASSPPCADGEENEEYLRHCQPRLQI